MKRRNRTYFESRKGFFEGRGKVKFARSHWIQHYTVFFLPNQFVTSHSEDLCKKYALAKLQGA